MYEFKARVLGLIYSYSPPPQEGGRKKSKFYQREKKIEKIEMKKCERTKEYMEEKKIMLS